jgi:hypothetical protein
MVKIATPILFESPLDELNRVRPLKLSEKSRFSLDLPVLSKNPVGTGQPIIGKFARCDDNGALLRKNFKGFSSYELISATLTDVVSQYSLSFTQKVFAVTVNWSKTGVVNLFRLMNNTYTVNVKNLLLAVNQFVAFNGWYMYFDAHGSGTWSIYLNVYGFY